MNEWNDLNEALEKINELIDLGFYDEALEQLEQASQLFPSEWELSYLFSRIWSERGEPAKALPYLLQALQLDKTNMDCLLGVFYTHVQLRQLPKGVPFLLKAQRFYPENELVLAALIWYYTEINELKKAVSFFEVARAHEITQSETLRNAALAYERLGDFDHAEECLVAALQIDPYFEGVRDFLADHYLARNLPDKCVALYRDYLELSPDNVRALSRLVFSLSQAGHFEEAATMAQRIMTRYPNSPVGYVDMAYLCLNTSRTKESLEYLEQALSIAPLEPEAFRVRGIIFSEQEKFAQAEEAFTRALALDPKNPEILRDYYYHLRAAGNFSAMETVAADVIKEEFPYCTEDYWFLADYYREKGNNRRAFHFLHKAYKGMPGERELIPPMVDILLDEGHVSYVVPYLVRYIERAGWNEDVMDYYGRHRRLRGKAGQEGLRLLRFYGQKTHQFRQYVFKVYWQRYFWGALLCVLPFAAAVSFLIFALEGLLWLGAAYGAVLAVAGITKIINTLHLQQRLKALLSPRHSKKKMVMHEP